ncbi:hypothetical protein ACFX13_024414 [Malus domestica]
MKKLVITYLRNSTPTHLSDRSRPLNLQKQDRVLLSSLPNGRNHPDRSICSGISNGGKRGGRRPDREGRETDRDEDAESDAPLIPVKKRWVSWAPHWVGASYLSFVPPGVK